MKLKALVAGAAAILTTTSWAAAADLPPAPVLPAAPPPLIASWTGVYIGGHIGYAWDRDRYDFAVATTSSTASGVMGGGQIGLNYQISSFVVGAEFDMGWSDLSGGALCPNPAFTCNHSVNWVGSLRGRAGFAAGDALFYVTGGWAFADVRHFTTPAAVGATGLYSTVMDGWALGGGVEYALTPDWSAKVEYLHDDLRATAPAGTLSPASSTSLKTRVDTIKLGVNYRFSWGAPATVVAKY
jgi:outer membrane immunogenic protein